ncbi:hypothetical protein NUM_55840 [Actinocatenispora comari]|uniref:Uncharacterized protein n=1 Tax=Actinocatenispora comari TaxID=2807577 RepID=A0A8J4AGQ3_9ACTN|nr:hypothetical protein NUM_55840 [Actinocatenispora comari]
MALRRPPLLSASPRVGDRGEGASPLPTPLPVKGAFAPLTIPRRGIGDEILTPPGPLRNVGESVLLAGDRRARLGRSGGLGRSGIGDRVGRRLAVSARGFR